MNTKQLIATVAVLAASSSAFADVTGQFIDFTNIPSTKSRTEVRAEVAAPRVQAQANEQYVETTKLAAAPAAVGGKTRAQVRAELEEAYAQGELNQNIEYIDTVQFAAAPKAGNGATQYASGSQSKKHVN